MMGLTHELKYARQFHNTLTAYVTASASAQQAAPRVATRERPGVPNRLTVRVRVKVKRYHIQHFGVRHSGHDPATTPITTRRLDAL